MSTLAIDRQWWRHAMPWRCCRPWFSACDQFQFAYPIKVCDFQPGIGNPIAQTRKAVTDAEFVLGMGSWANGNPKFTRRSCRLFPVSAASNPNRCDFAHRRNGSSIAAAPP
jgi:hypothetical protein